jgi:hypothetical protein
VGQLAFDQMSVDQRVFDQNMWNLFIAFSDETICMTTDLKIVFSSLWSYHQQKVELQPCHEM